jgi:chromosome segregation ATPase
MARKVLRDEKKGGVLERTGAPNIEGKPSTEEYIAEFGRFTEEASQYINTLNEAMPQLEARVAEMTARLDAITAIVNQLNTEMSKLTGDLYRTASANDAFHRELATLIGEMARTLPAVVDSRIAALLEEVPAEEKPTEEQKTAE